MIGMENIRSTDLNPRTLGMAQSSQLKTQQEPTGLETGQDEASSISRQATRPARTLVKNYNSDQRANNNIKRPTARHPLQIIMW